MKRRGAAKGSRNKKAYWRKGSNVADIGEGYAHHQYIEGLVIPDEDDLVTISTKPASTGKAAEKPKTCLQGAALLDSLRCHEGLRPSAVTRAAKTASKTRAAKWGPGGAREKKTPKDKTTVVEKKPTKFPYAALTRNAPKRKRANEIPAAPDTDVAATVADDIWAKPQEEGDTEGLDRPCADHFLRQTKLRQPRRPSIPAPASTAAAVAVAPPGASYNPAFEDHQALLKDVAAAQLRSETAADKLQRKLKPRWEAYVTKRDIEREQAQGLFGEGKKEAVYVDGVKQESSDSEESDEGGDYAAPGGAPVKVRRKSKAARRHEASLLVAASTRAAAKAVRAQGSALLQSKTIAAKLRRSEADKAQRLAKRATRKATLKATRTQTLSRHKFEEAPADFSLPNELAGSLRLVKPTGDVALDRLKSMQKRNLVEVGKRQKHKRTYKRKKVESREFLQVDINYLPK